MKLHQICVAILVLLSGNLGAQYPPHLLVLDNAIVFDANHRVPSSRQIVIPIGGKIKKATASGSLDFYRTFH